MFVEHPSSLEHDTSAYGAVEPTIAHPDQAGRMTAIDRELSARGWFGFERVSAPAVDRSVLSAVHPEEYVASIEEACLSGTTLLDRETVVSERSFDAALHAVGGAVRMVDLLLDGGVSAAFSSHRPPGHHALPTRAMGFCLFNNIAVAARHALNARRLERVMIIDWDVHHGNSTNHVFHASRQVLYVSIHQSPLFPWTGHPSDVGEGDGAGYTVNLPVPPGSGDEVWVSLIEHVVVPLAYSFEPQLVLISAGYDAHRDDPVADCAVTEEGFAAMTRAITRACATLGSPLGAVLEGGYAPGALARSVASTLQALSGEPGAEAISSPVAHVTSIARHARGRLAEFWPRLRR
ncbi:MAG TPA: histone deacetylase [Solirubrobacteraceae bacterium]|nr:histone deacetylase [Solirubrobacteraceae bacterium]